MIEIDVIGKGLPVPESIMVEREGATILAKLAQKALNSRLREVAHEQVKKRTSPNEICQHALDNLLFAATLMEIPAVNQYYADEGNKTAHARLDLVELFSGRFDWKLNDVPERWAGVSTQVKKDPLTGQLNQSDRLLMGGLDDALPVVSGVKDTKTILEAMRNNWMAGGKGQKLISMLDSLSKQDIIVKASRQIGKLH